MLHTLNGFLCAAIGFSLLDIINRNEKLKFSLSPVYLAVVAFCFSMTIGVLWEFFEFSMDQLFLLDMQKDTVVHSIGSVMLDPAGGNHPISIKYITDVIVVTADGAQQSLGLGGYLDIGIIDTMKDLFVNFIGAVVFFHHWLYLCEKTGARESSPLNLSPLWWTMWKLRRIRTVPLRNNLHLV